MTTRLNQNQMAASVDQHGIGTATPQERSEIEGNAGEDIFYSTYGQSGTLAGIKMAERVDGDFGMAMYHDGAANALHIANLVDSGDGAIDTSKRRVTIERLTGHMGINQTAPHSFHHVNGSIAGVMFSTATSTTVDDTSHTIRFLGSTPFTQALPTAVGISGRMIQFINRSTATITLDPDGSETIQGSSTLAMTANSSVVIMSDNSGWNIVAGYNI